MADNPRTDFDQPGLQAGQRPIGHLLGKVCALQEDAEIVCQCMKLKPHLVLSHALAGQPGPVNRLLAFLDVLLDGATLIVEVDDPVRVHRQVRHDEADAGEQFAGVPLDLGNNAPGLVSRRRLILEVTVDAPHMVGRTPHRTLEQMRDPSLQDAIGTQADDMELALSLQHLV